MCMAAQASADRSPGHRAFSAILPETSWHLLPTSTPTIHFQAAHGTTYAMADILSMEFVLLGNSGRQLEIGEE